LLAEIALPAAICDFSNIYLRVVTGPRACYALAMSKRLPIKAPPFATVSLSHFGS
jgi:hypothetical protein